MEETLGLDGQVGEFIKRYVVVGDDELVVLAVWVIHTHCFVVFPQTPYLAITSPEKQCGKSRLQEVLDLLVRNPWMAVMPSEAVVYRKIEADAPTLLLDEVDTIFSPRTADRYEGLRALLNSGHRRGAKVPRCVGPKSEVAEFSTFCPKVLAGIGTLPDTVADRSIPIRMERRTRDQPVEKFFRRDVEGPATALRDQIAAWCAEHAATLGDARPVMPEALSDREQEGCEPLVAIADALGSGDHVRAALVKLLSVERGDSVESMRLTLLRDLRTLFDQHADHKDLYTSWILDWLKAMPESPWASYYNREFTARDLGKLLEPYKVKPEPVRADGVTQLKGYRRAHLIPVWERYLPPVTVTADVTANQQ